MYTRVYTARCNDDDDIKDDNKDYCKLCTYYVQYYAHPHTCEPRLKGRGGRAGQRVVLQPAASEASAEHAWLGDSSAEASWMCVCVLCCDNVTIN